jgi:hypothetical protein
VTDSLLRKKLDAEKDAYDKPLGTYKVFSFLMQIVNDHQQVRRFMQSEGYSKTEICRTQSKYLKYNSKSKA